MEEAIKNELYSKVIFPSSKWRWPQNPSSVVVARTGSTLFLFYIILEMRSHISIGHGLDNNGIYTVGKAQQNSVSEVPSDIEARASILKFCVFQIFIITRHLSGYINLSLLSQER